MNVKHLKKNPIQIIYDELREEDRQYDKKVERIINENKRRPLKNLKKAWELHVEDWDEVDEFFETH